MRVWITRAEPGAARTAAKLKALGHEPIIEPVLAVRALPVRIDLDGVGALAFTSANGARAFAELCLDRGLPVFAVGQTTAEAARLAGFGSVLSADGDVSALGRLIFDSRDRFAGRILIAQAQEPAGNLEGDLLAMKLPARAQAVYHTVAIEPPPRPMGAEAVLVHSAKAARRLVEIGADSSRMAAYCISEAAAEPLAGAGFWKVLVALAPNEQSLLALLPGSLKPGA
jgi:uroporphyrinogen-III synthase